MALSAHSSGDRNIFIMDRSKTCLKIEREEERAGGARLWHISYLGNVFAGQVISQCKLEFMRPQWLRQHEWLYCNSQDMNPKMWIRQIYWYGLIKHLAKWGVCCLVYYLRVYILYMHVYIYRLHFGLDGKLLFIVWVVYFFSDIKLSLI